MKIVLFLLLAAVYCGGAYAQTTEAWLERALQAADRHQHGDREGAAAAYNKLAAELREAGKLDCGAPAVLTLNGLAVVHQDYGDYDESEKYYLQAIQMCSASREERSAFAGEVLANLGSLYFESRQIGRLRETAVKARRFLEGAERVSSESARLHHLIGLVARIDGKFDEANREMTKALEIWRSLPGGYEVPIGDALNSLGTIAFEMREYKQALAYFQRALEHYTGPGAATMASAATANVAAVYVRTHRMADADVAFARAIEMMRSAVGDGHPQLAHMLLSYASALEDAGEKRRARDHRKRGLSILAERESTLAGKHVVDVLELQGQ